VRVVAVVVAVLQTQIRAALAVGAMGPLPAAEVAAGEIITQLATVATVATVVLAGALWY
jgi:hypothetical protein